MMKNAITLTLAVLVGLALVTARAEDKKKIKVDPSKLPAAVSKQGVTYEGDIKAIFDKSCVKCHGAEKPKGKLRLDSLEGVMKGGEDGKVIEPGKSAESMLMINVAHLGDEDDFMPPPNNKAKIPPLTKEEMGLIRAWIEQGAK
jgi:hypothetical protein